MRQKLIQIVGLAVSVLYAGVIVWLFATEPRSFKEVATGAQNAESRKQTEFRGQRSKIRDQKSEKAEGIQRAETRGLSDE